MFSIILQRKYKSVVYLLYLDRIGLPNDDCFAI